MRSVHIMSALILRYMTSKRVYEICNGIRISITVAHSALVAVCFDKELESLLDMTMNTLRTVNVPARIAISWYWYVNDKLRSASS